jgi:hypothetical protein
MASMGMEDWITYEIADSDLMGNNLLRMEG